MIMPKQPKTEIKDYEETTKPAKAMIMPKQPMTEIKDGETTKPAKDMITTERRPSTQIISKQHQRVIVFFLFSHCRQPRENAFSVEKVECHACRHAR